MRWIGEKRNTTADDDYQRERNEKDRTHEKMEAGSREEKDKNTMKVDRVIQK